MPNMLSRLGMDTKELSSTDLQRSIYVPPPRPSYSQHHPSSPDINKTPLFPRESYQAARQTKIEEMLQEYLRNQEESTKKMERESISSMRALETNLKSYSSK
ncbi:unnamed protein product [Microthlaspi erraticum]|uniref:Uncharacterized protein n=1 Tax=Microthlaspi erraticum TaxID=1685480 RepID=A0A6D2HN64_9BRAS|nr:unnamed protein product [Microthlaspi erraticum]